MSTLKVNKIENTATSDGGIAIDSTGHVQLDGVQLPTAGALSSRNKIINGSMVHDQRNSGSSVAVPNDANTYLLDRWNVYENTAGAVSVQRSTTAPTGFTNSAKITITTADSSIGDNDIGTFRQYIEGFNIADLDWGTSSAKTVTLSFFVRSSLTGNLGGSIQNSAGNRSHPFIYTINTADTWEHKTVTISGDTSGTWNTNNSGGIGLFFSLCAGATYRGAADTWAGANYWGATGQVQPISTVDATIYITGVQLEVGEKATPFEHRSYGDELQRCLRYFQYYTTNNTTRVYAGMGIAGGAASARFYFALIAPMRTVPSVTASSCAADDQQASSYSLSSPSINSGSIGSLYLSFSTSGMTSGRPIQLMINDGGHISLSAEL
jgi:hypothetical protein